MLIKKTILKIGVVGLCAFLAACSTGTYTYMGDAQSNHETTADKGARYLLGRGVPQNNEKAFYYFNQAAKEGDPFAENELAYMYATGKGTPRDNAKAFMYYQKAARHGLANAQYNLGMMYLYGIGTPVNRSQAIHWFEKSAAHGFEPAKLALTQNPASN